MPRQFLNDSLKKRLIGTAVTVLSQFCTLMVCRDTSITSPSALAEGISIQSPTRIMSLELTVTPATIESNVSWNIRISTAIIAPRPDSNTSGERSINAAIINTAATANTTILTSCR